MRVELSGLCGKKCYEWIRMISTDHREPNFFVLIFRMSGVKESINQILGCVWITVLGDLYHE